MYFSMLVRICRIVSAASAHLCFDSGDLSVSALGFQVCLLESDIIVWPMCASYLVRPFTDYEMQYIVYRLSFLNSHCKSLHSLITRYV